MRRLQQDAAATGKTEVSKEEAQQLKAEGLARYHEQLAQHQAHLAAADAAARKAAGPGLGSLVAGATKDPGSKAELGSFDDKGAFKDCNTVDTCPEQQQVACSKPCQVSAAPKADEEPVPRDYDGIEEDDWQGLMADPEWAAMVAVLRGEATQGGLRHGN